MNFYKYYQKNRTYITHSDFRLKRIIKLTKEYNPENILDIGCGDGYLLKELQEALPNTKMFGVDVYKTKINGINIKIGDITKGLPYENNTFECVIFGEVIEHLPDPDFALHEIRRVLKNGGLLIISTPNLVSWANRIMVLFGLQPFFTETSTEHNLGRRFKILGQGEKVQGHLKIFTYKSLEEILIKEKFKIYNKYGVTFFFPFPISLIDRFFANFVSFASGLLYTSKK